MSEHTSGSESTFWTQNYTQQAPSFDVQVASLEHQPRDNLLASSPLDMKSEHAYVVTPEGEAMRGLAAFITEASALLQDAEDPRSLDAKEFLQAMRKRFFFLGTPEYTQACQGTASNWEWHLTTYPDSVINVCGQLESTTGRARSYNQVPFDIARCISPALRERVITEPRDWQVTEHGKLVAADDWTISGATAARIAGDVAFHALGHGKSALLDQMELHLLAAARNQLGTGFQFMHSGSQVFPGIIRSYFVMPPSERLALNHWGVLVSGAHSSTDYAFEMPLSKICILLESRGQALDRPRLTYLQRPYNR